MKQLAYFTPFVALAAFFSAACGSTPSTGPLTGGTGAGGTGTGSTGTGGTGTGCMGPTCNQVVNGKGAATDLCGPPEAVFDVLYACVCSGDCKSICETTYCMNKAPSQECFTCANTLNTGCGDEMQDCINN